jgi:transposase
MICVQLPEADAHALEQAFRQATDCKLRDRLQIVRLAHRGRPHQEIAADLGITPRTVQRWLNAYLERGMDGLRPRKAKGKTPRIPAAIAEEVRRWVIEGPAKQGLDRANWTHAELAEHLYRTRGIRASRSAMQRFCHKLDIRPYRPTVGTRDCKDLLYVLAVVNVITGVLHANTLESPARAKAKTGRSKTRRMQEAFAAHLRHIARLYPAGRHKRVVLIIDNAPWHRGGPIDAALADHPHLEFYRLPSYSPQLNVIERFWKLLRRRAAHNRLFDSLSDLKRSLRASLCYFQTMRGRVQSLIAGCYTRPAKRTESSGS